MLFFSDHNPFSTGKTSCEIRPIPGIRQDANRILIPVLIEGVSIRAMVDTGGVYLIIEPGIAEEIDLNPQDAIGTDTLTIRTGKVKGSLFRVNLQVQAEEGEDLIQEVTAFIPNVTTEQWGEIPTFLGLTGCLEFLKFAVDPNENQFYFASA
jgi:predicted aspartyl protease